MHSSLQGKGGDQTNSCLCFIHNAHYGEGTELETVSTPWALVGMMWKGRTYGMDRYCTLKGHQHFNVRSVPF
jgi:hypothetical protein